MGDVYHDRCALCNGWTTMATGTYVCRQCSDRLAEQIKVKMAKEEKRLAGIERRRKGIRAAISAITPVHITIVILVLAFWLFNQATTPERIIMKEQYSGRSK